MYAARSVKALPLVFSVGADHDSVTLLAVGGVAPSDELELELELVLILVQLPLDEPLELPDELPELLELLDGQLLKELLRNAWHPAVVPP